MAAINDVTFKGLRGPIGYYGGKQKIASWILSHIHKIPHSCYTEPFCGGAAVMFAKGRPDIGNPAMYKEVINDSSRVVTNMYKVMREHPEELARRVELTPYSQEEYEWAKATVASGHEDPIELARAMFLGARMGFANKVGGGWGTATIGSVTQGYNNTKDRLPDVLKRLRPVHIGNEDAVRFIQRWDSPQTLHYVDPPYPAANGTCKDYSNLNSGTVYTMDDFKRLIDSLADAKGSCIVSNYPQDIEVPSDWVRHEKATHQSTTGNTKATAGQASEARARTEVIWVCDRSATITHPQELKLAQEVHAAFNK